MDNIYRFDDDSPEDLIRLLAKNFKQRRLERGLSRDAVSVMSGVASSTIAKFETHFSISLTSFLAIAQALGYGNEIKSLLNVPVYNTFEELNIINKNKNRKRGRNKFNK